MQSPASLELAAARLDAGVPHDRSAVLERFALAEQLGDDRALEWVLTDEMLPALPEHVLGRARLALARVALQRGDLEKTWRHLQEIRRDDGWSYGVARRMLGELYQQEGSLRSAYREYQEAASRGDDQAVLALGELMAETGRYSQAEDFLSLVPEGTPSWGPAQARRVEVGLLGQAPTQHVLGILLGADLRGDYLVLAGPLLQIEGWRRLCWHDHADALEHTTRPEAQRQLVWLESVLARDWTASELWATWGMGPLPQRWFDQLQRSAEMAPLSQRLARLDSVPPSPVLASRRVYTVGQLSIALWQAYERAHSELIRALDLPAPRQRYLGFNHAHMARAWPYRGEIWADETDFWISADRCER